MSIAKATATRTNAPVDRKQSRTTSVSEESWGPAALIVGTLLFLSGTAALIYQILWTRQLTLIVGVEVYSITIAVSAFFAGLAGGGAVFGRWSDRITRPLQLYAALEISVALLGIAATLILANAAAPFVFLQSKIGPLAWLLPFLLVGIPAFLMGGTLPVVVRAFTAAGSRVARAGGVFYAANTAGGIAGALLSAFLLIAWLGVRGTAFAAAALNLTAGVAAFILDRISQHPRSSYPSLPKTTFSKEAKIALALYAVAGGIALGYEVVWSQAIVQFMSTRVFAFSVVLATYLLGLVLGSALYARMADRARDAWGVFGLLISAAGLIALLEIACLGLWQLKAQAWAGDFAFSTTGNEFARMCALFAVAALGIVFLPTILLGAAFPAALRLIAGTEKTGRDVGAVVALNTAGGILGTLLTGFLLIPALGLVRTLSLLAIAAALVGAFTVLLGSTVNRRMQWAVLSVGLAAIVTGLLTSPDRLARLLLTTRGGGELVFYQEGRGATVAVAQQQSSDNVFRRLYIQGVSNSGDTLPSMRYMRLQALLPLLIHRGQPQSALVIGFGTGITTGALLRYPNLEKRVCAELLPAVVRAGDLFPENYTAAHDARVEIRIRDGRQELLRNPEKYDLITLEPPPPSAEGVVNLYSRDFYALAAKRLAPNGLFAQWLPIATQNDEDTRSLVRSFLDIFPYATLWTTEMHEMLLVGSNAPIELDAREITTRFADPGVTTTLSAVGVHSPAALLATYVTGRDGLDRYAANALPVTDDQPRIEYAAWVRPREITRTLPELLALQSGPPLVNADAALEAAIAAQRQNLLDFYSAGIAAYNGDRDLWSRTITRVLAQDAHNPYYLWITGGK